MSEAYSVYWPQERWRQAAGVSQCLAVLFGGPHRSEPSFRRAAVQPGDMLYPIGVCDQVLYVLGRMRVQQIVAADEDQALLRKYLDLYSGWRFLAPTCTTEIVLGCEGAGVLTDRPLPGEILQRLTYRPRRGPRPVRHVSPYPQAWTPSSYISPAPVHRRPRRARADASGLVPSSCQAFMERQGPRWLDSSPCRRHYVGTFGQLRTSGHIMPAHGGDRDATDPSVLPPAQSESVPPVHTGQHRHLSGNENHTPLPKPGMTRSLTCVIPPRIVEAG